MSYTVNIDNTTITVYSGQVDTSTSLGLVGKNVANYGQVVAQNFADLLSHFANDTEPSNPVPGQIWFDSANSVMNYYSAGSFRPMKGLVADNAAPVSPAIGDLWLDTANYAVNVYTGNVAINATGWMKVGPEQDPTKGKTGFYLETVTDTISVTHDVFMGYLNNVITTIISKDNTFTLQTPINAISTINPGYNAIIGSISDSNGTISHQIDLVQQEFYANAANLVTLIANSVAVINSPVLTGYPRTSEPILGNTSSMIATTNFVANTLSAATSYVTTLSNQVANAAPLDSPVLTGTPRSTSPTITDRSTRIATTEMIHSVLPLGAIVLWYGSVGSIPAGWTLCDGNNSTPNLMDRSVIGAGGVYSAGTEYDIGVANSYVAGTQVRVPPVTALCYIMKIT